METMHPNSLKLSLNPPFIRTMNRMNRHEPGLTKEDENPLSPLPQGEGKGEGGYFRVKIVTWVSIIFTAAILIACSKGDIAKSSQVLAKVGDKEITVTYFERQIGNLPESMQKLSLEGEGKRALLDGMINREILYKEATKRKIEKDVELQRKMEEIKKELVINTFIQKEVAGKIKMDDKEIQDYFNSHPEEFKNREEIRISQIVVPEKKDADDILARLRSGEDFGKLAVQYSTDKPSAMRKGDVGFFTDKQLPSQIRDSVFRISTGGISEAHKMPGGYEIYKIMDRRVVTYTLDQIKEPLRLQLMKQKYNESLKKLLADLKKDIKIQINEGLLEK